MITEEFRKQFKQNLGKKISYSPEIAKILNDRQDFRLNGDPYSSSYIRMVFNGMEENLDIQRAIVEYYNLINNRRLAKENPNIDYYVFTCASGGSLKIYLSDEI